MPGSSASSIDKIPADKSIYVGSDEASGYVKFAGSENSIGYDIRISHTARFASMGPNATLALGLTECCSFYGRGMVYYYLKGDYQKTQVTRGTYPDSYIQLPDLLYVDYKWTDEERDAWMRSPHWQRLDLLSARGNTLSGHLPTMPITLCYESDDYDDILFYECLGRTILYYNLPGAMYLGLLDDMTRLARYVRQQGSARARWIASKPSVAQFQMQSGQQAVQQLQTLFQRRLQGTMFLYNKIVTYSIAAHRDWVNAGGYTIGSDPHLGPEIAQRVADFRARLAQAAPSVPGVLGYRLRVLRNEVQTWTDNQRQAVEDYKSAANSDVLAVSLFLTLDENWNALTIDQKQRAIDLWQLEQEAVRRSGA